MDSDPFSHLKGKNPFVHENAVSKSHRSGRAKVYGSQFYQIAKHLLSHHEAVSSNGTYIGYVTQWRGSVAGQPDGRSPTLLFLRYEQEQQDKQYNALKSAHVAFLTDVTRPCCGGRTFAVDFNLILLLFPQNYKCTLSTHQNMTG